MLGEKAEITDLSKSDSVFVYADLVQPIFEQKCFACHNNKSRWLSAEYIHGPVALAGCLVCHDPHGGDNQNFLWAEDPLELCIACHDDKESLVTTNVRSEQVHGIIPKRGCVVCHDPHATENPFMLKQPVNVLCSGCHFWLDKTKRGHPVDNHPVAAPSEMRVKGKPLRCTSCHNPHSSSYVYMLFETPMRGQICRACHAK